MTRERNHLSRRQALQGLAGATLALPFLPSIMLPRSARAASSVQQRYLHFATPHGGVWQSNMYPAAASLTEQQPYLERMIRRGALVPVVSGATAALSPVLSAPATALTQAIARKLNVIHGLDIPFDLGHHTGGHMGNYAANTPVLNDSLIAEHSPRVTIDQIMAWSPDFYSDLGSVRQRALALGGLSYGWSNSQNHSGVVQIVGGPAPGSGVMELFDLLFGPQTAGAPRHPVTDRILANYKRLRDGNRRLSSEDRRRLDDHVSRVAELDRRLTVFPQCPGAKRPAADVSLGADFSYDPVQQVQLWQAYNDVLAMALSCGATRLASAYANSTFSTYRGDWHQDIAHQAANPEGSKQQILADANGQFFRGVFLDLVRKLDAIDDGGGRTLLDNSLVVWTQECSHWTHIAVGIPVITAGSAGGALHTGSYIDYRNLNLQFMGAPPPEAPGPTYPGLLYNQFLATVLNTLGVPKAQWEEPGGGYGLRYVGPTYVTHYPNAVLQNNSASLPFLSTSGG